MQTKTYTTIDRSKWPSGPWDGEPDKMQWPDEATGLPCLAVRHPDSGHWCGYVGVAADHPMHGKGYEEPDVSVHGGLTYADKCQPHGDEEARGICHVPDAGEPDHVWWFGFDCAHSWDYSPRDRMMCETRGYPFSIGHDQSYKSLAFVRSQCRKLAQQLASGVREEDAA